MCSWRRLPRSICEQRGMQAGGMHCAQSAWTLDPGPWTLDPSNITLVTQVRSGYVCLHVPSLGAPAALPAMDATHPPTHPLTVGTFPS
jgi:hypothetical protein